MQTCMFALLAFAITCMSIFVPPAAYAQDTPADQPQATTSSPRPASGTQTPQLLQPVKSQFADGQQSAQPAPTVWQFFGTTTKNPMEIWMTTLAAVVLVAVLIIFAVLGRNQPLTGEFQKSLLIIVIIFSAILLITAGYSDAQIAPAFSLLGAIVGYLFGRTDWRADRFTTDPEVGVEEKQNGQAASGVGQTNRVAATNTGVSPPETKNRTTFPM